MKYGLIGKKLTHSFSKDIHSRLCGYEYELKELSEEELPDFFSSKNFSGINVTIPYKTEVIKYIDYIDNAAKEIGAVNTVVNRGGKLYGYNTDAFGLTALIKKKNIDLSGKKVLILGSGGTSKTAFYVAKSLKAKCVLKVSRNQKSGYITYFSAISEHNDADIIINTTPCGMYPDISTSPIDISGFSKLQAVVDVIYNPLKTRLVLSAENNGVTAACGLYMLISQAAKAAELFTDSVIESKAVDKVYGELLVEKTNIVLIGMPSSGKTTIGKALAKSLKMPFYDSDDEVYKTTGKKPAEIINENGEQAFRKIESEVISELSANNHIILATGGGVPTIYENILHLKSNGKIYFIDRPIELLEASNDRPLSSSKKDLLRLYKQRIDIYRRCADVIIKNEKNIDFVIDSIKEDFCYESFSD